MFTKLHEASGVQAAAFSEISSVQSIKHKRMMSVPKLDANMSKINNTANYEADQFHEEASLMQLIKAESPKKERTPT